MSDLPRSRCVGRLRTGVSRRRVYAGIPRSPHADELPTFTELAHRIRQRPHLVDEFRQFAQEDLLFHHRAMRLRRKARHARMRRNRMRDACSREDERILADLEMTAMPACPAAVVPAPIFALPAMPT